MNYTATAAGSGPAAANSAAAPPEQQPGEADAEPVMAGEVSGAIKQSGAALRPREAQERISALLAAAAAAQRGTAPQSAAKRKRN